MNEFSDPIVTTSESVGFLGSINAFLDSPIMFVIKIIIGFYCTVLILDIVMLVYLGDVSKKMRQLKYGDDVVPKKTGKVKKSWSKIQEKLDSNDENKWKLAILEAEVFLDQDLIGLGYRGENFIDKINKIPLGTFESLEKIKKIHEIRNKIIKDPNFEISHGQAIIAIETFEKFRNELGIE